MSIVEVPLCLQCGVPHIPEDIASRVRSGERITVLIIPHSQGIAANVLRWGTGAINVDACRIGTSPGYKYNADKNGSIFHGEQGERIRRTSEKNGAQFIESTQGRWPANLILSDEAAALLDEQSGTLTSGGGNKSRKGNTAHTAVYGNYGSPPADTREIDRGGASRFFLRVAHDEEPLRFYYTGKASRADRNQGVEELITWDSVGLNQEMEQFHQLARDISDDTMRLLEGCEWNTILSGSNITGQFQRDFSRIISTLIRLITELRTYNYSPSSNTRGCILAAIREMTANGLNLAESVGSLSQLTSNFTSGEAASLLGVVNAALTMLLQISAKGRLGNTHSTVKPTALMQWLVRLVTPPNGTALDPFCGSGSTGKAAMLEGFSFVGIDTEAEYLELARRRIEHARARIEQSQPMLLEIA